MIKLNLSTVYYKNMAKRPLEIDMCSSSQLRDTQGEMLNVDGADISELEAGRGRLNDNHGKGFFNCLGKVTEAKKIFKAEDCETERQKYYWEKVKSPYIYVRGELFDDEDHPNAKAAAAILRNIHKSDCPLKVKASVEGGVVTRGMQDPSYLARTKIHSVALTFVPANQATLVEPLNLDKSEWNVEADMILIKSVLHLAQDNVPSFRHITRTASAEKIENNLNKIAEKLGVEVPWDLKQALIEDSLRAKIEENVHQIHSLVKNFGFQLSHQHHDLGGGEALTHVKAHDAEGNVVGEALFNHNKDGTLDAEGITVHPDHQRKGIGTNLVNHAQSLTGKKIKVPHDQTAAGKPFWNTVDMVKALTAGYGGAGAPTNLTGGGVMQSEALDLGPKGLRYITCDNCGKEQVYGKFQVKCREPECGKAFSMNKLEKFFRINR